MSAAGVVYLRELQVRLEKPPDVEHWDVATVAQKLWSSGGLKRRRYKGYRWYFDAGLLWEEVRAIADRKVELIHFYQTWPYSFTSQPQGQRYNDYSEYLWEQALLTVGFRIIGRNTNYFNGNSYVKLETSRGPQPNLDYVARHPTREIYFGFSLKNKLDYPTDDEITILLDICHDLRIKPVMVARMMSGKGVTRVASSGGYTVVYKRWLRAPEMPRDMYDAISDTGGSASLLKLPLGVYRRVPDMLVAKAQEINEKFAG